MHNSHNGQNLINRSMTLKSCSRFPSTDGTRILVQSFDWAAYFSWNTAKPCANALTSATGHERYFQRHRPWSGFAPIANTERTFPNRRDVPIATPALFRLASLT